MKPEQKREIKGLTQTSLISAIITAVFMYWFYYPGWRSIAAGICIGGLMPVSLTLYTRHIYNRFLIKVNLLVALAVNTLAHLVVILVVAVIFIVIFYLRGNVKIILNDPSFFYSRLFLIGIGFGMLLTLGFNFFSILNTLIGRHVLAKLFIGIYRHPQETDRVFMFLDIKSSTTIAEQIGHLKFMSLVNDFFYDITEPVFQTNGEIYKYVGDEAIITWKTQDAVEEANCIRCFQKINAVVSSRSDHYIKNYGLVPQFKAGLHGGISVTGELGYTRREIAYMGDVLNTTARIEEACKTFGEPLLVSGDLVETMKNAGIRFKEVGQVKLRGKENEMALYGLAE
ncbi:MAG: adenylate/guanylate cyclase domain-containing protein [Bacteroidales bacterium]|nr:adenylate/guanylate cyclase domain-containing protein [Bacteroidales bacterium]